MNTFFSKMLPIDNFNLATKKIALGELHQLNAIFLSLYKSPGLWSNLFKLNFINLKKGVQIVNHLKF